MRPRHIALYALSGLLLTTTFCGCLAAHERVEEGADASTAIPTTPSDDPAYATSATSREVPTAPGCSASQWAPLAPSGLEGVRSPTIAAIDGGFVASLVYMRDAYDYPTIVARMRSDLTGLLDAPRDVGAVTSLDTRGTPPAMVVGGDGRMASCVAVETTSSLEYIPPGVAFFDATGALDHIARFGDAIGDGCADVAWVDGRWVGIEVTYADPLGPPSNLVVFDDTFAITRRIPLGYRRVASFADRVVGLHGRAIIAGYTDTDALGLAAIDLDTGTVDAMPFPFEQPIGLTHSQFALVPYAGGLGIAWIDAAGFVRWATFDDGLVPLAAPIVLGQALPYISYVDATPMDGGVVIAWDANALVLSLIADDGTVTRVDAVLPASVTGLIDTLEVAAQGDVVAVALDIDDPTIPRTTVGVWSSRCRTH